MIQEKASGSYFVEAKYIEFEGVKVSVETLNSLWRLSLSNVHCILKLNELISEQ